MKEPNRFRYSALRRAGLLSELFNLGDLQMPDATRYAHHIPRARLDLDGTREYIKEWERLADTSKAKFSCIDAVTNDGRVTSLWSGTLPDGRELFIISINRLPDAPAYDRGLGDRDEALSFFARFKQEQAA